LPEGTETATHQDDVSPTDPTTAASPEETPATVTTPAPANP